MGNTCTTPRDKYCPNCRLIIKVADKATQTDPGPPPPRMRDAASNTKLILTDNGDGPVIYKFKKSKLEENVEVGDML